MHKTPFLSKMPRFKTIESHSLANIDQSCKQIFKEAIISQKEKKHAKHFLWFSLLPFSSFELDMLLSEPPKSLQSQP